MQGTRTTRDNRGGDEKATAADQCRGKHGSHCAVSQSCHCDAPCSHADGDRLDARADGRGCAAANDKRATDKGCVHQQHRNDGDCAPGRAGRDRPAITAEWLLDAASARLAANKGARCPLRVALTALAADVQHRLLLTTYLRGAALSAACDAAMQLARSTPEVLCTVAMCDLCISWSRSLLAGVKPRAAAAAASAGVRLDFDALTTSFANASVMQKKGDDASELYTVRIEKGDPNAGEDTTNATEYRFANEATYVAYRYFLRHAWEDLGGVPPTWARPLPKDMRGWIDSAMRMRDLCLTLPQHRLCLPGPCYHNSNTGNNGAPYSVAHRQEGGRGGRLGSHIQGRSGVE